MLGNVFVHEELGLGCNIVPQAELGIVKPLLRIFVIFFIAYKDILNVPFSVLIILNEIVLMSKSLELIIFSFFEVLLQFMLDLFLLSFVTQSEVIVHFVCLS